MRKFFVSVAAICAAGCQPAEAPPAAPAPGKAEGFSTLVAEPKTLTDLAAEIAGKTLTAEAATQSYLDRIAAVDDAGPLLNAVLAINAAAIADAKTLDAAGASKGPLHGVPILLKDNIDTLDMPTTAGSMALKNNATGR
ncbi:MAG: amidase, partial [Burkholderiales bacterium]